MEKAGGEGGEKERKGEGGKRKEEGRGERRHKRRMREREKHNDVSNFYWCNGQTGPIVLDLSFFRSKIG